jgi:hypothetical protein
MKRTIAFAIAMFALVFCLATPTFSQDHSPVTPADIRSLLDRVDTTLVPALLAGITSAEKLDINVSGDRQNVKHIVDQIKIIRDNNEYSAYTLLILSSNIRVALGNVLLNAILARADNSVVSDALLAMALDVVRPLAIDADNLVLRELYSRTTSTMIIRLN